MGIKKFRIAVTCIGSGVGQSVVNSLRLSNLPVETVGFGNNPFAYGAYDCDICDYLPTIYSEDYIDILIEKCIKHNIVLVIPGLDDEALILSKNRSKFESLGIKILCSDEELISICRDKEKMSEELNKVADVFVKSYKHESLHENLESGKIHFPFIIKPKDGYASKGVFIINSECDLERITDKHVIQELALPAKTDPNYDYCINQIKSNLVPQASEISIQIVFSPDSRLLGKMCTYNKLNNGAPIEIIPYENDYVWQEVDKLIPCFIEMGLKGPLNIQGRITDAGLKIFEMNPRFTGITGLRAIMGFNEVEACVKEWLGIDKGANNLEYNSGRFGIRQLADKSISLERNLEVFSHFTKLNRFSPKQKKSIFITGATGYLGQNLINKLIERDEYNIFAFGRDKSKVESLFKGKVKRIFDLYDLNNGNINFGQIDILLHIGFKRMNGTKQEIAESLKFTNKLFLQAAQNQVPAVINISSQSVYGLKTPPLWSEQTPVAPETVYAQAKYATELMLESAHEICNTLHYSSIRLGSLAGGANGLLGDDFLSIFCYKAMNGTTIKVVGGMQQMERFDIRDAVDALIKMIDTDSAKWKPVYNLSSGEILSLKEIAGMIVDISGEYNEFQKSIIEIEDKNIDMKFGMDSTLFGKDMNWEKQYFIEDIVKSLMNYYAKQPSETVLA